MTISLSTNAWSQNDSTAVAESFQKVLEICQSKSAADLAPYVVYRGPDKERNGKDVCNYTNEQEKQEINTIFSQFKDWDLTTYKIKEYMTQKKSNGTMLHGLSISYQLDGESKEILVAFLKINENYAIMDID